MSWRPIRPDEQTLTAAEIVDRYRELTGHELHATNAGNAAKALDLDFVEEEVPLAGRSFTVRQKRYGVDDLSRIFAKLEDLAARRARWER